jgi:hypothetical protein
MTTLVFLLDMATQGQCFRHASMHSYPFAKPHSPMAVVGTSAHASISVGAQPFKEQAGGVGRLRRQGHVRLA